MPLYPLDGSLTLTEAAPKCLAGHQPPYCQNERRKKKPLVLPQGLSLRSYCSGPYAALPNRDEGQAGCCSTPALSPSR
jgi:hypothetical protein